MRRRGSVWMVVAAASLGTASLTAAASASIGQPARVTDRAQRLRPTSEPDLQPGQRAVAELAASIDVERRARGLPPLHLDDDATAAAQAHAVDMAATATMSHLGSDGADGGARLTSAGYVWSTWAENLGAGFFDAQTLVDVWMNSPGHRANLLGDFADLGVGVAVSADGVPYWSLLVGRRA